MQIISHRGFWLQPEERNQPIAFNRSFDLGLGTETDLRDYNGKIVVSHDMAFSSSMLFEDLLDIMAGRNLTLALNIKADGLAAEIKSLLKQYNHTNYFVFDMSIPDLVQQIKQNMIVFTGLSDLLPHTVLLEECAGIWLDSFKTQWYETELIDNFLGMGKKICIVSSELHKRDNSAQWKIIKQTKNLSSNNLLLCTDTPIEAINYFIDCEAKKNDD